MSPVLPLPGFTVVVMQCPFKIWSSTSVRGRFGAKPRKWVLDRRVPATEGARPGTSAAKGRRPLVPGRVRPSGLGALGLHPPHRLGGGVGIWLGLAVAGNVTSKVSSFVSPLGTVMVVDAPWLLSFFLSTYVPVESLIVNSRT